MRASIFCIVFLSFSSFSLTENSVDDHYLKVFKDATKLVPIAVKDTISDEPVNVTIFEVYKDNKRIGFLRDIHTTTGCNSACLPVSYTSFYDSNGKYLKVLSRDGLTKKNHAPFTDEDYSQLEFIISLAPSEFNTVKHPTELTDGLSGATLPKYKDVVVKDAAYSTLRIHVYNLNTQNLIKNHLKKLK